MRNNELNKLLADSKRPIILDGAMGSNLQSVSSEPSIWTTSLITDKPNPIKYLHKQYIKAGSEIITTNTFRTNPLSLLGSSYEGNSRSLTATAAKLAIEASEGSKVLIAGSNPPAEDCYQTKRTISHSELILNHHLHITNLIDAGCNFLLHETMSHLDEIKIVCEYSAKNQFPFMLSLFFQDGKILSGEKVEDIVKLVLTYNPACVLFNCIRYKELKKLLKQIEINHYWGFYLNCGSGEVTDDAITCSTDPEKYVKQIKKLESGNLKIVGGCCGTSPEHIKSLRKYYDDA